MQQSVCTYKNNFISSVKINSVIEKMVLDRTEKAVLTKLLYAFDLTPRGHDLSQTKTYSIAYWSKKIGYSYAVVKRCIEKLHARSVILIYGKTWNEYLREDGTRVKTRYMLDISLNPSFAEYLVSLAGKVQAVWQFDYSALFQTKLKNWKQKAQEYRDRHIYKAVNMLLNSCEQVGIQDTKKPCEQVGIQTPHLLNQFNLNTKPINSNAPTAPRGLMNGINKLIDSMTAGANRKMKEWNESATSICLKLLDSGMTYHDVGRQMISQRYCRDMIEFKKYISPPNIC